MVAALLPSISLLLTLIDDFHGKWNVPVMGVEMILLAITQQVSSVRPDLLTFGLQSYTCQVMQGPFLYLDNGWVDCV